MKSIISAVRHARNHTQLCPTLTSQSDTAIYTSGSNSGGVREGVTLGTRGTYLVGKL